MSKEKDFLFGEKNNKNLYNQSEEMDELSAFKNSLKKNNNVSNKQDMYKSEECLENIGVCFKNENIYHKKEKNQDKDKESPKQYYDKPIIPKNNVSSPPPPICEVYKKEEKKVDYDKNINDLKQENKEENKNDLNYEYYNPNHKDYNSNIYEKKEKEDMKTETINYNNSNLESENSYVNDYVEYTKPNNMQEEYKPNISNSYNDAYLNLDKDITENVENNTINNAYNYGDYSNFTQPYIQPEEKTPNYNNEINLEKENLYTEPILDKSDDSNYINNSYDNVNNSYNNVDVNNSYNSVNNSYNSVNDYNNSYDNNYASSDTSNNNLYDPYSMNDNNYTNNNAQYDNYSQSQYNNDAYSNNSSNNSYDAYTRNDNSYSNNTQYNSNYPNNDVNTPYNQTNGVNNSYDNSNFSMYDNNYAPKQDTFNQVPFVEPNVEPNNEIRKAIDTKAKEDTIGEIAPIELRKKAYIMDKSIFLIPTLILYFVFLNPRVLEAIITTIKYSFNSSIVLSLISPILGFIMLYNVLYGFYYVVVPVMFNGQTIGMKANDLRIVTNDVNSPNVTLDILFKREFICKFKSSFFLKGYLKSLKKKQNIMDHDLKSNTRVIYEKRILVSDDYGTNIGDIVIEREKTKNNN